jgi:hypothetical protein
MLTLYPRATARIGTYASVEVAHIAERPAAGDRPGPPDLGASASSVGNVRLVPCQETFALSQAGQNRRWLRPRPRRTKRAPSSCVLASNDSDSAWTNERSLTRH